MSNSESLAHRVLVPIDRSESSERAIPFALALLSAGDSLVLLHAGSERDTETDVGLAHLGDVASRIDAPEGVTIQVAVVNGKPAEAIHDFQVETGATAVVMTTSGRGAAGRLRFGSVADQVFRSSAVPVILVPLHGHLEGPSVRSLERVVVPLDGSERADHALPLAAQVAKRLGLPITVLNVMEISDLTKFDDPAQRPSPIEAIIANDDAAVRERLEAAIADLDVQGVSASWKIVSGNWAAQVIEDEIGQHDFVVMVSHGRGGVRRWLFGSVAERLVHSGRSVVMLAPPVAE